MKEVGIEVRPVTITEAAIVEMNKLKKELEVPAGYYLRLGVKSGGCSGFSYMMVFDQKQDGDTLHDFNGFEVLVHGEHLGHIQGMEVDFVDGLENRGFTFNNPNAKSSCGCGDSFSV